MNTRKYFDFQLFAFFLQVVLVAYEHVVWKDYFTVSLEILGSFIVTLYLKTTIWMLAMILVTLLALIAVKYLKL